MMTVTFPHTLRDRPLVLVNAQVRLLALDAGRDVDAELKAMAQEHVPCKTVGQLLRHLRAALLAQTP